ncbi:MAG: VOC family protein [Rothia sp. (in: high G+C Gram-positive bacteria)]|nr:VOC family protein [Rothia sp. (in: high G+C Gram-positive bacteria)]
MFTHNEGISFIVQREEQEQLDALLAELTHQKQPCGWRKGEFSVNWQVAPANLGEQMSKSGSFVKLVQTKKIKIDQS